MTGDTNTSTDTTSVVERDFAAVEAGDGATIRQPFAGSVTWRLFGDMPFSRTWGGRDSIMDEFVAGALGFTARDGKIQAVREYMDTAYATRMLFGRDREAA
jgi:ketosteroid isomerase-like protein